MSVDPRELLELATGLATEAGQLLRRSARRSLSVATKTSATDPVSEADEASERLIVEGILAARPDDGLLGEEGADRTGTSGLTWVVDPIDGTVNFLYGIPAWCVSICVEDAHGALVGVIHDPSRDELFTAIRGAGARLDGEPITVNPVDDLAGALIGTGFAYAAEVRAVQGPWVADLLPRARDVRRVGAAALDLAWTAAGRLDGFYEFGLKPWDRSAGELLVREAGGRTSRMPITAGPTTDAVTFAGAPAIHDALVAWFAQVSAGSAR